MPGLDRGWGAFLFFMALAVAATWPLATGLARDIPWDHGDALLICWMLGWNAHLFLRALAGDPSALAGLWHTNIFYPERYTLAYSETLLAPALQVLPIYALTDNLVLSYNVLFLGSYVLSALGMYLFVREVTGDWRAGIVGGAIYGFMPYRVEQGPHLQVLSSQWMPFALYAFRRWFQTGRTRSLAGAVAALITQNLTCGYYLVFFAPFVPAYVVWEVASRRRWRDWRMWRGLIAAAAAVSAVTIPAMWPYVAIKRIHAFERGIGESVSFAADVMGWFTASPYLNFWGPRLQAYSVGEGHLFPGAIALVLAIVGGVGGVLAAQRATASHAGEDGRDRARRRHGAPVATSGFDLWRPGRARPFWQATVALAGATVALVHGVGLALLLLGTGRVFWFAGEKLSLDPPDVMLVKALVGLALTLAAPSWRRTLSTWLRQPAGFFCVCAVAGWWLSLGPEPHTYGQALDFPAPYRWLFEYVPGVNGLRVPARFAMVTMVFVAALAALGFRWVLPRSRRAAHLVTLVTALVIVAESGAFPQVLNARLSVPTHLLPPPKRLRTGWNPTPLSRWLVLQEDRLVLAQFPFGEMAWEIHYVYESTAQRFTPMVNGYSGWFPPGYIHLVRLLADPLDDPADAWQALAQSGATHAVVHRAAYRREAGRDVEHWLEAHGARRVADLANVQVFQLPRR